MRQRVRTLLEWCDKNGITLLDIELVDNDANESPIDKSGIYVVARNNLNHSDIVAKIPKSTVLSKKTSRLLAKAPNINTTGDDTMELALIIAYEIAMGEQSRWFGYIQSLPQEQVPVAALWEDNDDEDSRLAFLWLQGTETKQATYSPATGCSVSTDFDVCPICGALQSCPHDEGEDEAPLGPTLPEEASPTLEDTCDMIINAPVEAGDEVFNTYDSNLPNSVLLARYGFILEGNEYDYLSWDSTTLPQSMQIYTTSCRRDFTRVWTADLLTGTTLVYDPTESSATSSVHPSSEAHGRGATFVPQYKLNADGLVSIDLWVLVAVTALKITDSNCADTALWSRLERLAAAQVYAENKEPHGFDGDPGISDIFQELGLIASLIQDMCRSRLLGMYRSDLSSAECGNLLDDLPDNMIRSRFAISQALCERATLSACTDVWHDLAEWISEIQTVAMQE
ncbi:hypothetical protein FRC07_001079 [Ceratobasidium sp. 392]|nr:hypothetical protein FRC07_001079 [Ceratobasidium sp. 392]